jgi:hypothetical protein
MRNYQIAQETDAQNGVTAEGCVKGLLQSSTPSQTLCWMTCVTWPLRSKPDRGGKMSEMGMLRQLTS